MYIKTNNDPILGPSYLKRLFILHLDHISTGNKVGMQSYFLLSGSRPCASVHIMYSAVVSYHMIMFVFL